MCSAVRGAAAASTDPVLQMDAREDATDAILLFRRPARAADAAEDRLDAAAMAANGCQAPGHPRGSAGNFAAEPLSFATSASQMRATAPEPGRKNGQYRLRGDPASGFAARSPRARLRGRRQVRHPRGGCSDHGTFWVRLLAAPALAPRKGGQLGQATPAWCWARHHSSRSALCPPAVLPPLAAPLPQATPLVLRSWPRALRSRPPPLTWRSGAPSRQLSHLGESSRLQGR